MLIDNPWMKSVLNIKKPKGYDKYLKHLVKQRMTTLKMQLKQILKSKSKLKLKSKSKSKSKSKKPKKR